jgi:CBS domain containing-hemolysin-like protein
MTDLMLLLLALAGSALFAGSETGYYALNPLKLKLLAGDNRLAALCSRTIRPAGAFLIMLLVGNNLANNLAVAASVGLLAGWNLSNPELWSTLLLTPIVFLFGEVGPKQFVLGDPQRSLLRATPFLLVFRILLLPVTYPIGLIASLLNREDAQAVIGRRHLAALLLEGGRSSHGEAPVLLAALRALESQGKGLRPYLRTDFPLLSPRLSGGAARAILAQTRDTLGLVDRIGKAPGLLLGTRLVHTPAHQNIADIALDLPQFSPDLDLAEALVQMRAHGASFALVGRAGKYEGLLDLEFTLSLLLPSEPHPARVQRPPS